MGKKFKPSSPAHHPAGSVSAASIVISRRFGALVSTIGASIWDVAFLPFWSDIYAGVAFSSYRVLDIEPIGMTVR